MYIYAYILLKWGDSRRQFALAFLLKGYIHIYMYIYVYILLKAEIAGGIAISHSF